MKRRLLLVSIGLSVIVGFATSIALNGSARAIVPGINTLVSVNSTGSGPANEDAPYYPGGMDLYTPISANGEYIAFSSKASDLVVGDTNGKIDTFVRNIKTNSTIRVNVSSSGAQANDGLVTATNAGNVAISSTGRYVAFLSSATNLIDGKTTSKNQIYLRDTKLNITSLVTQNSSGYPGNGLPIAVRGVSNDGKFVLWRGDRNSALDPTGAPTTGAGHIYLSNLKDRTTRLINAPSGYTGSVTFGYDATMSCDGAGVVFSSELAFDAADTNSASDLFFLDIRDGYNLSRLTSVANGKGVGNVNMSCNGQYITLSSKDSSFSPLIPTSNTTYHNYLYDRISDEYKLLHTSSAGVVGNADTNNYNTTAVDDHGDVVFISGATNLVAGITPPAGALYLRNNYTGGVEVLSVDMYGVPIAAQASGHVSISSDGEKVAHYTPLNSVSLGYPMFAGATNKRSVIVMETGL